MKKEEKEKKKKSSMVLWLFMGHRSVTPAFGSVRSEFKASWDYLGRPSGSGNQGLRMAHAQGLETLTPQKQREKENKRKHKILPSLSIAFCTAETFPLAQEASTPSLSTLEVSAEGA